VLVSKLTTCARSMRMTSLVLFSVPMTSNAYL
jgi:hypothetical protein